MGAFKIQTDLDLSGFNLLNFCIQSYTDLENVPNLGLGRKLFFTGNSTDEKNLREVIWDGVEWKAAAYLDDIEAITNGDGSLGTRVKALEDMLGLEDVTDVIDTWNDVKEFFDNVDEGLTLMTMLDDKLSKSKGGTVEGIFTIKNYSNAPLVLNSTSSTTGIDFLNDNTRWGYLGFSALNTPAFINAGGGVYTLLHKGNYSDLIGDYYLKTTGGTIDSASQNPLTIKSSNATYSTIKLQAGNNYVTFGAKHRGDTIDLFVTETNKWDKEFFLLHSGNVGEYKAGDSALFDGVDSSNYLVRKTGNLTTDVDFNELKGMRFQTNMVGNGSGNSNYDHSYGYILSLCNTESSSTAYNKGLQMSFSHQGNLSTRVHWAYKWSDWKTIAFTDSTVAAAYKLVNPSTNADVVTIDDAGKVSIADLNVETITAKTISGNASSATKLQDDTAFTAWGQTFFENGKPKNVTGALYMPNNTSIYMMNADGTSSYSVMYLSTDNALAIGNDHAYHGYNTLLSGNEIRLRYGTSRTNGLILNSSGNVTIGANDLAGSDYKLLIHGVAKFTDNKNTLGLYTRINGSTVQVGRTTASYTGGYSAGLSYGEDDNSLNFIAGVYDNRGTEETYFYYGGKYDSAPLYIRETYVGICNRPVNGYSLYVKGKGLFTNTITASGGLFIPTGQKMTFGADGPTMEYDADANAIKVTGNIYATGTMASGGKAAEGEGDTGGGGNANVYSDVLEGVITQEWEVGNPFQKEDVIVSLYMWNTDESRWEMVLADIGVTSENIWVTFGRPTSTTDKYMAVVMG